MVSSELEQRNPFKCREMWKAKRLIFSLLMELCAQVNSSLTYRKSAQEKTEFCVLPSNPISLQPL